MVVETDRLLQTNDNAYDFMIDATYAVIALNGSKHTVYTNVNDLMMEQDMFDFGMRAFIITESSQMRPSSFWTLLRARNVKHQPHRSLSRVYRSSRLVFVAVSQAQSRHGIDGSSPAYAIVRVLVVLQVSIRLVR